MGLMLTLLFLDTWYDSDAPGLSSEGREGTEGASVVQSDGVEFLLHSSFSLVP